MGGLQRYRRRQLAHGHRLQAFDGSGGKIGGEFLVNTTTIDGQFDPSISVLADGRVVVTWVDQSSGVGTNDIRMQIVDPRDGIVTGTGAADTLYGHDAITDEISGYAGADTLHGLNGNDQLYGGSENDAIFGGKGDDTAYGGTGEDTLTADAGDDDLFGEDGNDTLIGGIGADYLGGGGGTDRVSYGTAGKAVTVSLSNPAINSGDALGDTFSSIENISGSAFNDALNGNSAINAINGGAGNDILKGYAGNDTLTGYSGADIFVFNTALNAATNVDRITDFNVVADTIHLDDAIFTALAGGALAASAFKDVAIAAKDAGDRILYNSDTGNLYYDADGSGAAFAAIKFAALTGNPAITAADFVVI